MENENQIVETVKKRYSESEGKKERYIYIQTYRQTHTDRHTDRQTDIQTHRQTDKQA